MLAPFSLVFAAFESGLIGVWLLTGVELPDAAPPARSFVASAFSDVTLGGASDADSSSDLSLVESDVLRFRGVRFPLH